jgi:3',5'-cyclic AMP phosphodiesterase CpdA
MRDWQFWESWRKLFLLNFFTDTFLSADPPGERVFRAMFRVVQGDAFSPELADPATEQFRIRARDYRERLNLVFRRSDLRPAFLGTEVLALDGSVPPECWNL